MSLLEDIKTWYEDESYPPDGPSIGANQVQYDYGDSRRWGTDVSVVYERDGEYVQVDDVSPATENQSWGDYGDPGIYVVDKYEEVRTITTYRRRLDS